VSKRYPWFYTVNDRPVQIVETKSGGTDCLVYEHKTGNFVVDRSYFEYVTPGSGKDVDELDAAGFGVIVAARRAELVKKLAEKLCSAKGTTEQDVIDALGVSVSPAPLGGSKARVGGGMVPKFEVELGEGALARADLDARLGAAQKLPRTGPGAAHTLAYAVRAEGAPYRCTVFASFEEEPRDHTAVKSVMFRLDGA
jgi:hypothetical protein